MFNVNQSSIILPQIGLLLLLVTGGYW